MPKDFILYALFGGHFLSIKMHSAEVGFFNNLGLMRGDPAVFAIIGAYTFFH